MATILVTIVAREHRVDPHDVVGRSRRHPVLAARREAARRLRLQGLSYRRIGQLLGGRHGTTVRDLLGEPPRPATRRYGGLRTERRNEAGRFV